ncbi:hypothetical protein QJS10_CPA02g00460 [Acorus calamus]|uniref:Uncharacterized protein n=1 Tax=Acorus calamus TaxID=4465 RepID=A0AAV9FGX5_ACOCL|nr:hypothetical protein QJS10_CPA02g00460 [Acorus calamus]
MGYIFCLDTAQDTPGTRQPSFNPKRKKNAQTSQTPHLLSRCPLSASSFSSSSSSSSSSFVLGRDRTEMTGEGKKGRCQRRRRRWRVHGLKEIWEI